MFGRLGTELDNLITDIMMWNRGKPWYKLYVYIKIKRNIREYSGIIDTAYNCKYLYKRHYEKLVKMKKKNLKK